MLYPQHFHDKFEMRDCYFLLLIGKKKKFSDEFKFEVITNNHLRYILF